VAERLIRTLNEQCLWAQFCNDVDELRQSVATFIETYNNQWLIERLGHRSPREGHSIKRQLRLPRDSQRICPTNWGRNRRNEAVFGLIHEYPLVA